MPAPSRTTPLLLIRPQTIESFYSIGRTIGKCVTVTGRSIRAWCGVWLGVEVDMLLCHWGCVATGGSMATCTKATT